MLRVLFTVRAMLNVRLLLKMNLIMVFRLYLNFGHTIGHAVEATAGYGKVMHGEAVAIGMVQILVLLRKKA